MWNTWQTNYCYDFSIHLKHRIYLYICMDWIWNFTIWTLSQLYATFCSMTVIMIWTITVIIREGNTKQVSKNFYLIYLAETQMFDIMQISQRNNYEYIHKTTMTHIYDPSNDLTLMYAIVRLFITPQSVYKY